MSDFLGGGSGGGGGTPGGADTNIQYNDAGVFAGNSELNFNDSTKRLGAQVTAANTRATIHADAVYGETTTPPVTFTATLSEDVAIDSPGSGSATEIGTPTTPSSPGMSLIQIDYVNAGSTSQNTMGGSYTCNGQTIYYRIYAYRTGVGAKVVNPNYYSTSFTDMINDGTTLFTVDITSIATSLGNYDGFIIAKSFDGSNYNWYVDIGSSTSYNDNDFTNTDAYEVSAYAEDGTTNWNGNISQYAAFNGTNCRSGYVNNYTTDSNQSQYLIIVVNSWGSLVNDGFIVQHHNGYYFDISTATSYYDWGQSTGSIGDYTPFTSIAFPHFYTSLTGSSTTSGAFSYGSGSYTADGSTWVIDIWEYSVHPYTNEKYFVGSPDTYSLGTDANDLSSFQIDWSTTIGDGNGRYVVIKQNGTEIYEQDYAGTTASGTLSGTSSIISKPNIGSYAGILRNFSAYGEVTSPAAKYSSTHNDYSFTDSNPVDGYIIRHSWATFGNATQLKVLQDSYADGSLYWNTTTATFDQMNTGVGDATVTPNTIGWLSDGSQFNRVYRVYTRAAINSLLIYSSSYIQATTTDPSDGKYYNVILTWSAVSGANDYKLYRTVNGGSPGYKILGSSTTDSTLISWTDPSTLTPTTAPGSTAIFERTSSSNTDPAILVLNEKTSSVGYNTGISMTSSIGELMRIGTTSSGYAFFKSYNNVFDFMTGGSPYIRFLPTQTEFNVTSSSGRNTLFKAIGGVLAQFETTISSVLFGETLSNFNYDPNATVAIQPKDTSDAALLLYPKTGAGDNAFILLLKDSSSTVLFGVTNSGKVAISAISNNNGNLYIGAASSNYTQIQLADSGTLPSTPVVGGIEYQSGNFYGTNASNVRKRFVQALDTSTNTYYWRSDSNGYPQADTNLWVQSGAVLNAGLEILATQGLSLSTGKTLTVGSSGTISMGSAANIALNTSTGTKIGTATNQKLGFWNATAITQPANTVAINDVLVNTGLRASGGTSDFTTTIKPRAGGTAAGSEPLKFTSAALLTTATAGTQEFLTDDFYTTITTGTARKRYVLEDAVLTSGRIPFATTNGRLTDDSDMTFATDTLTITKTKTKQLIGNSSAPTIAAGAGAGTTPTVSIAGTDTAGAVSVTTGTLPTGTNATVATITFNVSYASAPYVVLYPANAVTATLSGVSMVFVTQTTTTFAIVSGTTALTASTAYKWNYMTVG